MAILRRSQKSFGNGTLFQKRKALPTPNRIRCPTQTPLWTKVIYKNKVRGQDMKSRSALTKLKAILIIDVLVVAAAAGVYFYLQAEGLLVVGPKPAEFTVTDLTISPLEAEIFEPVLVTVNVTNIGDEQGEYVANLTINGMLEENQTVLVLGQNYTIVEFTLLKETEGTYTVEIAGLTGTVTFKVPPPTASKIGLTQLVVNPYEAWSDETVTATVTATNQGSEPDKLLVKLMVDDLLVDRKVIELDAKESTTLEFVFNATTEGKHTVKVNALSGSFMIVPTGYHTLRITYSGGGSDLVPFTLNGESENMPYTALLPVGKYTITVPGPFSTDTAVFEFNRWSNGETSTTVTIDLQSRLIFVATYDLISGYSCCPSLFYWNGSDYVYVTEVSNAGWLGYIDYLDENGDIIFGGGNPWDTIKLDPNQLTARNAESGEFYDVILLQKWDEIFYLDTAYMMVIDHPSNVDVYSTMVNYVNQDFTGQIYTVSKDNLITPVSAFNEKGENVLPQIAKQDGLFTPGSNGLVSPAWNDISLNQLTLNLGDLSDAEEIKLVINGMIDWGAPEHYYEWIGGFEAAFAEGVVPAGTQIYPAPFMEVLDANGNWVRVPKDRQMPTPSDYVPRSFVVDLTGLFPADVSEYQIRINNFFNVTFDYIGIDTTSQDNIKVQRINADANLHQVFASPSSASGDFTRYGDVTQLILECDDMFVVGLQGDQVSLRFPTAGLAPVGAGLERDFFLFVACWFKDPPGNWGYGFDFAVEPLPFRNMSGFPYPSTEHYPSDEDHSNYLLQYNTRTLPVLRAQWIIDDMLILVMGTGIVIAGILSTLIWIKARAARKSYPVYSELR
jgi:hypothetical protein